MAEVSGFSNIISLLSGADAFSLLFPFILAWILYYLAIEKTGLFDDDSVSDNLSDAPPLIAMILAFFTARFLVMQPFYQSFFSVFFGKIVIGLSALLGLFALSQFAGVDPTKKGNKNYVAWIAISMAGAALIWAGGFGPGIFGPSDASNAAGGAYSGIVSAVTGFISYLLSSGVVWFVLIGAAVLWIMIGGGSDDKDKDKGKKEDE